MDTYISEVVNLIEGFIRILTSYAQIIVKEIAEDIAIEPIFKESRLNRQKSFLTKYAKTVANF